MYRETSVKMLPLTRKLAVEVANMDDWRGERPLRPGRIDYIQSLIESGGFYSPEWATAEIGKRRVRVNGQHTSHVLATLNGSLPRGLTVVLREYECDSEEDLANLFSTFDSYHSVRSMHDLINAHASIHKALEDLSRTTVNKCLSGIATYMHDGRVRKIDREERVSLLHSSENRRFIVWGDDFVKDRQMGRTGVVGAMFATWLRDEYEATLFWTAVQHENDPSANAPSRVLARFLRENSTNLSRGRWSPMSKQWTPRAFYVKSMHAWNAHRRGETTTLKYYPDSDIPEAL